MREKAKVPWRDKQKSISITGEERISCDYCKRVEGASVAVSLCHFWNALMLPN